MLFRSPTSSPTVSMPYRPPATGGAPTSSPTVSMPYRPPATGGAPASSPTVSMPYGPPATGGAPISSPTVSMPPARVASSSTGTPSSSTQHIAGAHYLAIILFSSLVSLHIYREA